MADRGVVIDTNIFIDFLRLRERVRKEKSLLRKSMSLFICHTTTLNAVELYAGAKTQNQKEEVEFALNGIEMLNLSFDSPKLIGSLFLDLRAKNQFIGEMDSLIAGICIENQMPIVTRNVDHFKMVPNLVVIPAEIVKRYNDPDTIIQKSIEFCAG